MNGQAGVWIDRREAIIVFVGGARGETTRVRSGVEAHPRYSGRAASEEGSADDQRDGQFAVHLRKYYDDVVGHLRDTESILVFGPGEAKHEFEKRLASEGLSKRLVGVATVDKMTDNQIAAKVRDHFLDHFRE